MKYEVLISMTVEASSELNAQAIALSMIDLYSPTTQVISAHKIKENTNVSSI